MRLDLFGEEKPGDRVPPGQTLTKGFPVLHTGGVPEFDSKTWDFKVWGLVEHPVRLDYDEFMALPKTTIQNDIHCVTGWSKLDNTWEGVPVQKILAQVHPKEEARYVMVHADGNYTTNIPLEDFRQEGVLLAFRHNGEDLTPEHGWPLRLVLPELYFWKSAKWVRGLEFMPDDRPGFWEARGYHMYGNPWKEQRYW